MKTTFRRKFIDLEQEVKEKIASLLIKKGTVSKHRDALVLRLKKEQQFNLDGGRYATEITQEILLDNCGYEYAISVLPLDELCEIVDTFL